MNISPYKKNRIYCGDNSKLIKHLPDNCIDLTVTSPPYDKLRDYNGHTWDFETLAKELFRVTADGGVVVWVVGDETKDFNEGLTSSIQKLYFHNCGFNILDTMIYLKNSYAPAYPNMMRYAQVFEYMFIFTKNGRPKTFNPVQIRKKESSISRDKTTSGFRQGDGSIIRKRINFYNQYKAKTNVWDYPTGYGNTTSDKIAFKHPAILSETLVSDHILSWSNTGDLVFDPFMGSGTTAKMAMQTQRYYLGFEISQEYIEIAKERLRQRSLFNAANYNQTN